MPVLSLSGMPCRIRNELRPHPSPILDRTHSLTQFLFVPLSPPFLHPIGIFHRESEEREGGAAFAQMATQATQDSVVASASQYPEWLPPWVRRLHAIFEAHEWSAATELTSSPSPALASEWRVAFVDLARLTNNAKNGNQSCYVEAFCCLRVVFCLDANALLSRDDFVRVNAAGSASASADGDSTMSSAADLGAGQLTPYRAVFPVAVGCPKAASPDLRHFELSIPGWCVAPAPLIPASASFRSAAKNLLSAKLLRKGLAVLVYLPFLDPATGKEGSIVLIAKARGLEWRYGYGEQPKDNPYPLLLANAADEVASSAAEPPAHAYEPQREASHALYEEAAKRGRRMLPGGGEGWAAAEYCAVVHHAATGAVRTAAKMVDLCPSYVHTATQARWALAKGFDENIMADDDADVAAAVAAADEAAACPPAQGSAGVVYAAVDAERWTTAPGLLPARVGVELSAGPGKATPTTLVPLRGVPARWVLGPWRARKEYEDLLPTAPTVISRDGYDEQLNATFTCLNEGGQLSEWILVRPRVNAREAGRRRSGQKWVETRHYYRTVTDAWQLRGAKVAEWAKVYGKGVDRRRRRCVCPLRLSKETLRWVERDGEGGHWDDLEEAELPQQLEGTTTRFWGELCRGSTLSTVNAALRNILLRGEGDLWDHTEAGGKFHHACCRRSLAHDEQVRRKAEGSDLGGGRGDEDSEEMDDGGGAENDVPCAVCGVREGVLRCSAPRCGSSAHLFCAFLSHEVQERCWGVEQVRSNDDTASTLFSQGEEEREAVVAHTFRVCCPNHGFADGAAVGSFGGETAAAAAGQLRHRLRRLASTKDQPDAHMLHAALVCLPKQGAAGRSLDDESLWRPAPLRMTHAAVLNHHFRVRAQRPKGCFKEEERRTGRREGWLQCAVDSDDWHNARGGFSPEIEKGALRHASPKQVLLDGFATSGAGLLPCSPFRFAAVSDTEAVGPPRRQAPLSFTGDEVGPLTRELVFRVSAPHRPWGTAYLVLTVLRDFRPRGLPTHLFSYEAQRQAAEEAAREDVADDENVLLLSMRSSSASSSGGGVTAAAAFPVQTRTDQWLAECAAFEPVEAAQREQDKQDARLLFASPPTLEHHRRLNLAYRYTYWKVVYCMKGLPTSGTHTPDREGHTGRVVCLHGEGVLRHLLWEVSTLPAFESYYTYTIDATCLQEANSLVGRLLSDVFGVEEGTEKRLLAALALPDHGQGRRDPSPALSLLLSLLLAVATPGERGGGDKGGPPDVLRPFYTRRPRPAVTLDDLSPPSPRRRPQTRTATRQQLLHPAESDVEATAAVPPPSTPPPRSRPASSQDAAAALTPPAKRMRKLFAMESGADSVGVSGAYTAAFNKPPPRATEGRDGGKRAALDATRAGEPTIPDCSNDFVYVREMAKQAATERTTTAAAAEAAQEQEPQPPYRRFSVPNPPPCASLHAALAAGEASGGRASLADLPTSRSHRQGPGVRIAVFVHDLEKAPPALLKALDAISKAVPKALRVCCTTYDIDMLELRLAQCTHLPHRAMRMPTFIMAPPEDPSAGPAAASAAGAKGAKGAKTQRAAVGEAQRGLEEEQGYASFLSVLKSVQSQSQRVALWVLVMLQMQGGGKQPVSGGAYASGLDKLLLNLNSSTEYLHVFYDHSLVLRRYADVGCSSHTQTHTHHTVRKLTRTASRFALCPCWKSFNGFSQTRAESGIRCR